MVICVGIFLSGVPQRVVFDVFQGDIGMCEVLRRMAEIARILACINVDFGVRCFLGFGNVTGTYIQK